MSPTKWPSHSPHRPDTFQFIEATPPHIHPHLSRDRGRSPSQRHPLPFHAHKALHPGSLHGCIAPHHEPKLYLHPPCPSTPIPRTPSQVDSDPSRTKYAICCLAVLLRSRFFLMSYIPNTNVRVNPPIPYNLRLLRSPLPPLLVFGSWAMLPVITTLPHPRSVLAQPCDL